MQSALYQGEWFNELLNDVIADGSLPNTNVIVGYVSFHSIAVLESANQDLLWSISVQNVK